MSSLIKRKLESTTGNKTCCYVLIVSYPGESEKCVVAEVLSHVTGDTSHSLELLGVNDIHTKSRKKRTDFRTVIL